MLPLLSGTLLLLTQKSTVISPTQTLFPEQPDSSDNVLNPSSLIEVLASPEITPVLSSNLDIETSDVSEPSVGVSHISDIPVLESNVMDSFVMPSQTAGIQEVSSMVEEMLLNTDSVLEASSIPLLDEGSSNLQTEAFPSSVLQADVSSPFIITDSLPVSPETETFPTPSFIFESQTLLSSDLNPSQVIETDLIGSETIIDVGIQSSLFVENIGSLDFQSEINPTSVVEELTSPSLSDIIQSDISNFISSVNSDMEFLQTANFIEKLESSDIGIDSSQSFVTTNTMNLDDSMIVTATDVLPSQTFGDETLETAMVSENLTPSLDLFSDTSFPEPTSSIFITSNSEVLQDNVTTNLDVPSISSLDINSMSTNFVESSSVIATLMDSQSESFIQSSPISIEPTLSLPITSLMDQSSSLTVPDSISPSAVTPGISVLSSEISRPVNDLNSSLEMLTLPSSYQDQTLTTIVNLDSIVSTSFVSLTTFATIIPASTSEPVVVDSLSPTLTTYLTSPESSIISSPVMQTPTATQISIEPSLVTTNIESLTLTLVASSPLFEVSTRLSGLLTTSSEPLSLSFITTSSVSATPNLSVVSSEVASTSTLLVTSMSPTATVIEDVTSTVTSDNETTTEIPLNDTTVAPSVSTTTPADVTIPTTPLICPNSSVNATEEHYVVTGWPQLYYLIYLKWFINNV